MTTGKAHLVDYLAEKDRLKVWRDETLIDDERIQMVDYAKNHFGLRYDYLAILVI